MKRFTTTIAKESEILDLEIYEGDEVTVTGVKARVRDRELILASKITSGDHEVKLDMASSRFAKLGHDEEPSTRTASSDKKAKNANRSDKQSKQDSEKSEEEMSDRRSAKSPDQAVLGVAISDTADGGVVILAVHPESSAAKEDLHQGDEVLEINGEQIGSAADIVKTISQMKPDDKIELKIRRGDEEREVNLVLTSRRKLTQNQ